MKIRYFFIFLAIFITSIFYNNSNTIIVKNKEYYVCRVMQDYAIAKDICNSGNFTSDKNEVCCPKYPENCCNDEEFISKSWNTYFEGSTGEWRKNICCNKTDFSSNNPDKCPNAIKKKERVLTCSDASYKKKHYCACKKLVCNEDFIKDCTGKFLYEIYQIIKIGVTSLLVLLTIIDFVKALMAGDNSAMKKNINNATKRVIIVIILLFGPSLINLFLGLISNGDWSTCGIK